MRRFALSLAAASAMAMAGFCFAADPQTPNNTNQIGTDINNSANRVGSDINNTANRVGTDVNNAATDIKNNTMNTAAPDADSIRKTIAKVTEDAVTKGDFHKMTKNFVDADYKRVEDFKSSDNFATLDGRIDQFRKDWKAKYNEEFGYNSDRQNVLNDQFARITQGEIGEARTAGGKETPSAEPQNVKGGTSEDLNKSGVNQPDANSNKTFGGDTKREPGRDIATFTVEPEAQASMKMQPGQNPPMAANMEMNKEMAVPMIHEVAEGWKIDIPDNLDGQKLHDALLKHLTMFDEDKANWPADKNEAYREATRHVLMALTESGT
jgi:hypothetical protein